MSGENILHYKGYSTKPEYSVEDRIFWGKILGISDLILFHAENAKDIETEFHSSVDDYLRFCEGIGKQPQKEYSGMFNVRIPPELHRKISMEAEAKGVSLNKAVEQAIAAYV